MRRKSSKPIEGDDGRTIANMNVEGMPWYTPGTGSEPVPEKKETGQQKDAMTREESRYYTWGALKAALAVVGVMCAGIVLFVLFCLHIWFR